MIKGSVEIREFSKAINAYSKAMQKGVGAVIKDESRLLAERLRQLTPPKTQQQGQDAVQRDMHKVYQEDEWFTAKFQFRSEKLAAHVKELIEKKDQAALNAFFQRSARLARLRVEEFNKGRHQQNRDNRGRVKLKEAVSMPLGGQSEVDAYTKAQQKNVGLVKGGFGACVVQLGGKSPSWLNRSTGEVKDHSADPKTPYVEIINKAPYASSLLSRLNVVPRALAGRISSMKKNLERKLEEARKFSRFG